MGAAFPWWYQQILSEVESTCCPLARVIVVVHEVLHDPREVIMDWVVGFRRGSKISNVVWWSWLPINAKFSVCLNAAILDPGIAHGYDGIGGSLDFAVFTAILPVA